MLTYRIRKTHLRIPDPDPIFERTPTFVIDLWSAGWIIAHSVGPCFSSAEDAHAWAKTNEHIRTITEGPNHD